MNKEWGIAGIAIPTSVAAATASPVGILEAPLWSVEINGVPAIVTGQSLIVIATAIVGIGSLIVAIIKVRRGK